MPFVLSIAAAAGRLVVSDEIPAGFKGAATLAVAEQEFQLPRVKKPVEI